MAMMVEKGEHPELEVKEVPEEIKLPEHLSELKAVETAYKANVKDGGQALKPTPQNQAVTITLPADQGTLTALSRGPIGSAVTWLAAFWLRMIKKAIHFGWRIVGGTGQNAA